MHEIELVLALMVAVAALATVARALRIPYPILLVLGGLVLALLPVVPDVRLAPELVFLLFLPPLLYIAAFETSIRDVRALLRPILSLAVGLVLVTTAAVAVVTHALVPQLGWPAAFALGAIVSPPDAVAAAAIFRGLGVSRRLVTLLESESLFNDATALVAYRVALAATATATFSAGEAGLRQRKVRGPFARELLDARRRRLGGGRPGAALPLLAAAVLPHAECADQPAQRKPLADQRHQDHAESQEDQEIPFRGGERQREGGRQ
jgi:Sodium/hydrogen exchanger family